MINAMDLHKAGQRVRGLGDGVGGEEKKGQWQEREDFICMTFSVSCTGNLIA